MFRRRRIIEAPPQREATNARFYSSIYVVLYVVLNIIRQRSALGL